MQLAHLLSFVLLCLLSPSPVKAVAQRGQQQCDKGYKACNPNDDKRIETPEIGGGLSSVYVGMLQAITGVRSSKQDIQRVTDPLEVRDVSSPSVVSLIDSTSQVFPKDDPVQVWKACNASSLMKWACPSAM